MKLHLTDIQILENRIKFLEKVVEIKNSTIESMQRNLDLKDELIKLIKTK